MKTVWNHITESRLLAKATITSGKQVEIIAVFEKSTYYQFFFVFSAASPKSDPKDWSYKYNSSISGFGGKVFDLDTFMHHELKLRFANKIAFTNIIYFMPADEFREHVHKIGHPYENVERIIPPGATFERSRSRRRGFWFNQRNRAFDSLPVRQGEVLVYDEWCSECNTIHRFAHYPDGKTQCKVGVAELRSNPGMVYAGHNAGMFTFRYRAGQVSP